MGKNLLVCAVVEDHLRPIFVRHWTEFLKGLLQQKFTVDLQFGMNCLLTVSDDYDYVLLLNTNVLFELDHFMALYYKIGDKHMLGALLQEYTNTLSCIEEIETGVFMSPEKIKGREVPFVVDCASINFLLMKKSMFEHLRQKDIYVPIEITIVDAKDNNRETTGMLPDHMTMFLHLKEKGVRAWVDPTVQIRRVVQAIV